MTRHDHATPEEALVGIRPRERLTLVHVEEASDGRAAVGVQFLTDLMPVHARDATE
jgi:hypothetical protein